MPDYSNADYRRIEDNEFPFLFSPIRINTMEVKNRIVMTSVHLGYSEEKEISDRLIEFYALRARGGVGLIILGAASIDEIGGRSKQITFKDDESIDEYKMLIKAVKNEGARIAAQIVHLGRFVLSADIGGRTAVSASAVPSKLIREIPRALDIGEIPDIQDKFAQAAVRVKAAGFDAVEILAGYLISQFLSPLCNFRNDDYGGSLDARMRFGLEVIEKVRKAVGPEFPVQVRFSGSEFITHGYSLSDGCTFASELQKRGADLINVTGGPHETEVPQLTMDVPRGGFIYMAQSIKSCVSVPVITSNRINDPALAEEVIRNGQADLVAMTRAIVADPNLPNKARTGKAHLIYHCIGCNQGCLDNLFLQQPVCCTVNPRAGRERELTPVAPSMRKKILVIGGGPAGMKVACTAAELGHDVTLIEKQGRLGGQVLLNRYMRSRREFVTIVRDLTQNINALNIAVIVGKEADVPFIQEMAPDVVVLATGAQPIRPDIAGIDGKNVVQAWDVLNGEKQVGRRVVILGGNAVGVETAIYVAGMGTLSPEAFHFLAVHNAESQDSLTRMVNKGNKDVTIVEMTSMIGRDIGATNRWPMMKELTRLGVTTMKKTKAVGIKPDGVQIESPEGAGFIGADSIVIAVGVRSENSLADLIRPLVPELYVIGDAKKPRKVLDAIREGFQTGLEISRPHSPLL